MEDLNSLSIDELKKIRLKEKKTEIKDFFKNPLDKATSIDELLRELIQKIGITNRILLALYIQEAEDGSMVAKPIAGVDMSILKGLKGDDDYKTIVKNIEGAKITGSGKIFELEGSGILAECKFQSSNLTVNNKAYGVRIMSDNSMVYQDTWANFFNRSFYETDMSCWEDVANGYYILAFKNMAFAKNLIIEVYGAQTTSFSNIYLKYHLKVVS